MARQDKTKQIVPFDAIDADLAFNARKRYVGIAELARDIEAGGLIEPLGVRRKADGRYSLEYGFRRHKAIERLRANTPRGKKRPFDSVAVNVHGGSEKESFLRNLRENHGRSDLRMWEIGLRATELQERYDDMPPDAVADAIGYSKKHMQNCIRVSKLHPDILAHLRTHDIPAATLLRWASKNEETQAREFEKWLAAESEQPNGKRKRRAKGPKPRVKETARLLAALKAAGTRGKNPDFLRGARATARWLAGLSDRPPVPLTEE